MNSDAFTLTLIRINDAFTQPIREKHSCLATSFRLLLGELLPHLSRIIYLDIDVIVRGDLARLYDIDLRSKTVGAVPDRWINEARRRRYKIGQSNLSLQITADEYVRRIIGLDARDYFNTGVLLIDLERWRANDVMKRCLTFFEQNFILLYTDQDAINSVCMDDVVFLGEEWNFIPRAYQAYNLPIAHIQPQIVHFAGPKPWETHNSPAARADIWDQEYWSLACATPFGGNLREAFYLQIDLGLAGLQTEEKKIPRDFQLSRRRWYSLAPERGLKLLAEFLCSAGRLFRLPRVRERGEAIFVYRDRAARLKRVMSAKEGSAEVCAQESS